MCVEVQMQLMSFGGGAGRAFFAYHCETCSKQLDQDKSQTRNEIAVALWH